MCTGAQNFSLGQKSLKRRQKPKLSQDIINFHFDGYKPIKKGKPE